MNKRFILTAGAMFVLLVGLAVKGNEPAEEEPQLVRTEAATCMITETPEVITQKASLKTRKPTLITPLEIEDDGPELISIGVFRITSYCSCSKCCGKYAASRPKDKDGNDIVYGSTGAVLKVGTSIAVDPTVIPYGTEVVINGHTYIAQDCGGAIKGSRIDIYNSCHEEAANFGVQYIEVFLKKGAEESGN